MIRTGWQHEEIEVDHGSLRVWTRSGTGRPIVALHGFTGSGGDWQVVDDVFADRPVIAPDLPGHAGSAGFDAARSVDELADLVDRVAFQRLGPERFDLVGYSFGGRVAATLAVDRPGRIGASPGLAEPASRRERRRVDAERADRIERDGVAAFLAAWARVPIIATQQRISATDRRMLAHARAGHTAAGLAAHLREAGVGSMRPLHDALDALTLSTVLVTGVEDAKYDAIAASMASRRPDRVHVRVPNAGHAPHLEAPQTFCALVRPMLHADRL
jgi:2-succinyl-6-hydroxy-2,4-cyclohexadiene-1-carboxylate synthase